MIRTFFIAFLALCMIGGVQANGKKEAPLSLSFHLETHKGTGKALSFPIETIIGKKYVMKAPEIATSDIVAFRPFPSPDDAQNYGVVLQLNKTAARRLKSISVQHKGSHFVTILNGRAVDMLEIDRGVDGRYICVWRGIDLNTIKACDKMIPRIGETKKQWKKRLKKEKKKS